MSRKVLDTVDGEGGTEFSPKGYRTNGTVRTGLFQAALSTGDVVVIYGRLDESLTEQALATISSTTEPPFQVILTPLMRVARTTDGLAGESVVFVDELGD